MLRTEREAKKTVCSQIRECINTRQALEGKAAPVYRNIDCLASGCMSWRWAEKKRQPKGVDFDQDGTPKGDRRKALGYCGRAGTVEK